MSKPPAAAQRPDPGNLVLDHVSHFVEDPDAVATLLERLGFVVTPVSTQTTRDAEGSVNPAGAENRNVMLGEGYLEFLSPTIDTPVSQRMRLAMARYAGVHLVAFGTPAAEEEHARLERHGFEPLPFVRLEREVDAGTGKGGRKLARFAVVRVPPEKMPEGRIQFVEHLTPEAIWQPHFLAHRNGVEALAAAFVVAEDPVEAAARFARFCGALPAPVGKFVRLSTARGALLVGRREDWRSRLGEAPLAPALAGYALACRDPIGFAAICAGEGLPVQRDGDCAVVRLPPALGSTWLLGTAGALEAWAGGDA